MGIDRVIILDTRESTSYERLLRRVLPQARFSYTTNHAELSLLVDDSARPLFVFTDGRDLCLDLYGSLSTAANLPYDRARDIRECKFFDEALNHPDARLLGFGRGSHLLWAELTGELLQKVGNHVGAHDIVDLSTGESVKVVCFHDQAVDQTTWRGEILAVDYSATSHRRVIQNDGECSVVTLYPSVNLPLITVEAWSTAKILGIQYRPDLSGTPVGGVNLFYKYFRQVILGD